MELQFSETELSRIAEILASKLSPAAKPQPKVSLDDWIRADDLYERKLFSKTTLNAFYHKGLIGKSTIGGVVCYYIPDVIKLLKDHYVWKSEEAEKMNVELRKAS